VPRDRVAVGRPPFWLVHASCVERLCSTQDGRKDTVWRLLGSITAFRMLVLKFIDGMTIDTGGGSRVIEKADGLYVGRLLHSGGRPRAQSADPENNRRLHRCVYVLTLAAVVRGRPARCRVPPIFRVSASTDVTNPQT
jgi:hypothetical protein